MVQELTKLQNEFSDLTAAQLANFIALYKGIADDNSVSSKKLTQKTGLPLNTVRRLIKYLNKTDIRAEIKKLSQLEAATEVNKTKQTEVAAEIIEEIATFRRNTSIKPDRAFDQFFATPSTTYSKAEIISQKKLINNANIALLGDDDFVSFSLLHYIKGWSNLTILDIDDRILTTIKTEADKVPGYPVKTIRYDARNDLPKSEQNKYNLVVTDPPYTKSGVTLFLNRAIELLDTRAPAYIFLYFGTSHKTPEKTLKIQEILNRMGLVIEDKLSGFAKYETAHSIGSTSDLYILKLASFTKPLQESVHLSNIYTHSIQKEEKFPFVDHMTFKLFGVPKSIVASKSAILARLGNFCTKHKLKVVDKTVTKFKSGGITVSFVLANSNLTVHTWPEHNAVHIDLVTCMPIYNKDLLAFTLNSLFKPTNVEARVVE